MKKVFVLMTLALFLVAFVAADATYYEEDYDRTLTSDSSFIEVTKLRYESYPVSPGDYFTLYIEAQNIGTTKLDVEFQFLEEYPFSLDSNENAIRKYSDLGNEPVVLEYKVRVSDDAVSGENTLKIRQKGVGATIIREFDIMVEDVQTSFDAVVQDNSDGEVSIALANIGQNDASAAIVRIPDQEGVSVSGTNGQMIGNLEQGDYTVVGFTLSSMNSAFQMQIDYTDSIGVRRSEVIEIPLSSSGVTVGSVSAGERPNAGFNNGSGMGMEEDGGIVYWTYLIWIFVFTVIGFVGYRYFGKRNVKGKSSSVPKWMVKEKGAKR